MPFTHIHCSSRFDRSAASLESDLDDWMAHSSLITLTEVNNDNRAARLREKGWGHFNAKLGGGRDDCAIAWDKSVWHLLHSNVTRLSVVEVPGKNNQVYACTVGLKQVEDGEKLLATVTHMPAHVEAGRQIGDNPSGHLGRPTDDQWLQRKKAYLSSLQTWSTYVKAQDRKHHSDGTLVVADWNINLKLGWVQDLLDNHWGKNYRQVWRHFPTEGGSMTGGPTPPPGAPGVGYGDRIIDGSLVRGLKPNDDPVLMPRVKSSDHRPYREQLHFLGKNEHQDSDHKPSGDTQPNFPEWWGFGDYINDDLYPIPVSTGDEGGEVL